MKKLSGKLTKTAGALGLAVAALTTVSASPAMASTSATAGCTKTYHYDNVQVQVDNCSEGWVWIFTDQGHFSKGIVHVTTSWNGPEAGVLEAERGKAVADKFKPKVSSIVICGLQEYSWSPPTWWTFCGNPITV
ncbi:hypothetical protein ACFVTF_06380 [Kitasatospora sp. NPDC057940]|uniref:hypothetical protein n=1 Tax=Kitasatospora sp. NPDC057940 TaxID=3346285 RepID=UPI0036D88AEC